MKFGACLPTFGSCADRYVLSGYSPKKSLEEMFARASRVNGLGGIELVGNWHLNEGNFDEVKGMLERQNLKVCMMVPDLWTQGKWGLGTFTSKDPKVRQAALEEVKKVMDLAVAIDCDKVDLWFGQDGFDYSFQADYVQAWNQLVEGVRQCADHNPEVKVCIEYKLKEPRTHLFVNGAAKTLLLIEQVDRPNVGVLLDVGHSLAAGENVAEAISLSANYKGQNRLIYVHFNDNYRSWDDDLMVGSVHTIELLELLYWLTEAGYQDWFTLDIFPYREDGVRAAQESIAWIEGGIRLLERVGHERIGRLIAKGDPIEVSAMLREALLG